MTLERRSSNQEPTHQSPNCKCATLQNSKNKKDPFEYKPRQQKASNAHIGIRPAEAVLVEKTQQKDSILFNGFSHREDFSFETKLAK